MLSNTIFITIPVTFRTQTPDGNGDMADDPAAVKYGALLSVTFFQPLKRKKAPLCFLPATVSNPLRCRLGRRGVFLRTPRALSPVAVSCPVLGGARGVPGFRSHLEVISVKALWQTPLSHTAERWECFQIAADKTGSLRGCRVLLDCDSWGNKGP